MTTSVRLYTDPSVAGQAFDAQTAAMVTDPDSDTSASLSATYVVPLSVLTVGAVGDGITDDRDALAAISAADIIFPAGTYRIGSNLTLAGAVRFKRGATLKPDNGVTVTFTQGTPEVGWYRVFDTTAGGTISFGNTQVGAVRAVWFGAKADGATDDTAAIKAAANSMPSRGTLELSKGTHNITGNVVDLAPGRTMKIVGQGRTATTVYIVGNLTDPVIYAHGTSTASRCQTLSIESLTIRTENRGYTGDAIVAQFTDYLVLRDVNLTRIVGHAIKLTETWDSVFESVSIVNCGSASATKADVWIGPNAGDANSSSNHQHWTDVQIEGSDYISTYIGLNSLKNRFVSCKWHGSTPTPAAYPLMVIDSATGNVWEGCTFHNAGSDLVQITNAAGITPAGNKFIGCSFNAAGVGATTGYGIYQTSGDRTIVESSDFGVNGTNDLGSILVAGGTLSLGDTVESWDTTKFTVSGSGVITRKSDPSVWLTPEAFGSQAGSPALSNSPGSFTARCWLLDASSAESIVTNARAATWVTNWDVDLYWTNASAGSGAVKWRLSYATKVDGATLGSLTTADTTATAPAQDVLKVTRLATKITLGDLVQLLITRVAADAADTLANDAAVLGVRLSPNLT